MKLNEVITSHKKQIEDISIELDQLQKEFRSIRQQRKEAFLEFFDKTCVAVGEVYKKMSGNGGSASISLLDRDQPFGTDDQMASQNIIYEFKPANKQFDSDISARSGGEKTIAGLALIFALASLKKAPFILLDEVDAHLDPENVSMLANYLC
jgi:chromosome segregation ATPase